MGAMALQQDDVTTREIPGAPLPAIAWLALAISIAGMAAWEWQMRTLGLRAGDLGDSASHWTVERRKIAAGEHDDVVIFGSSRILFDTDLDAWEEMTGRRPIQLALPGTSPRFLLSGFAANDDFEGLVVVGVTPEARDEAEAFRGEAPEAAHVVDDAALDAFYRTYPEDRAEIDLVVFSAPQLSVLELRRVAELLRGRRVHANTALLVTTNFANREMAARLGHVAAIEGAGGRVLSGTCWYIMEPARMAAAFGWRNVLTNSAKIANILGGYRLHPILRRTPACIEAAVTGRLPDEARLA